ncbi:MAG: polysaccharide biosynthesis tyrosine autokinase [Desulfobacula sp.]|nr:polysaccharide biosynthesis tyrosine autokinase [Desulfobacula sp.]
MGKIFKALKKSEKSHNEEPATTDEVKETFYQKVETKIHQDSFAEPDSAETLSFTLDTNLISALKPHSVVAEQFRNLKNNILFPEKGNPPRTIMVTSTSPGEGKSFVAANLAVSIAQNIDEYVLLMDCDLRAPSIDSMFGFGDVDGLSEYLSNTKPIATLLLNTFLDKLKILPAGHIPDNPSELLSSDQMKRLLHEVKLRYSDRYIIMDTPPPYVTSETSALARQVDGIILVVRQGHTRKQDIHDIIDIYGREKILGVVYNDAKKPIGYGYGKYGYGKYGYGTYGHGQK